MSAPAANHPRSSRRPLRRTALALLIGAVVTLAGLGADPAAVAAVASQPAAAADPAAAALSPITFYGRGWGHGVGMSQYGARGRALAGQLAPAILAHYYAGTTAGTRDPATIVRVLLLNAFAASTANPVTIVGLGGPWTIDGFARTFPAKGKVTLAPTADGATSWTLKVFAPTGTVLLRATVSSAVIIRPAPDLGLLQLTSKASTSNVYRGYLRIRLTTTATVVNHVGVDAYLRGVVPLEMPASWSAEALKVQVIAARSYALHAIHPTTGTFDLYDDTRSQVYRGQKGENAATDALIAATSGKVLLDGTTVANCLFHSADGGWTENNENVFVSSTGAIVAGPVSYLRGSSDRAPDGSSYDKTSPYATWQTATYTNTQLSGFFASDTRTNVGTISSLDLSRRGVSGRLISVTLVGSLGSKTVSGDVFRSVFNTASPLADPALRGNLFDIAPIP
jgi:stage II sporulation protein D